jgi:Vitamin K-dependent gamma-carboxylase
MILQNIARWWESFFFKPESPICIALFRVLYGICVSATIILLHSDWLEWYGTHAWVSERTMHVVEPGIRLNLFGLFPENDRWIAYFFWIALLFSVMLTIGLWTRVSSIAVFLCLNSLQQRALFITHGGDKFLRVAGFFLMFAPAGAVLSVDHFLRLRNRTTEAIQLRAPWAQRMIQFELTLLYFTSFLWKLKGHMWLDGTALYYVIHLRDVQRLPVPEWVKSVAMLKLGSWLALVLEFSLGVLIWFKRFRYPLLFLGLCFHLCLEYAFNFPMFQWDVLSAYVLFIDPEDLNRAWRWILRRFDKRAQFRRASDGAV